MKELNPEDYGYKDDSKVVISGALFNKICSFVEGLGQEKGSEVGYEQKEDMQDMLSPENKPKHFTTPIGMFCLTLSTSLNEAHMENIELGNAVSMEELNKPQISLEKA